MAEEKYFYKVRADIPSALLRDHLSHGYEEECDFRAALQKIVNRWKNREGEPIADRNGFLLLRFHDTPGCVPDEEWLPTYLLDPVKPPEPDPLDEITRAIEDAYGFD